MRKFSALLKKEMKELLTLQMIIPLVIGMLFFVFIGNIAGNETRKAQGKQSVAVLDLDKTERSQAVIDYLTEIGFNVSKYVDTDVNKVIEEAKEEKTSVVLSIPKGFEKGLMEYKPQQVDTYSIVSNFSVMGSIGTKALDSSLSAINEFISNQMLLEKSPDIKPEDLKNPIKSESHVIIGERQAAATLDDVTGFITSQTAFIPIIMFIVIVFAAQMIAVTVASEKENKTLETLLSTPVKRSMLVVVKMVAAGLVSLVFAAVYMVGFRYYMNGFSGGELEKASSLGMSAAIQQLGLTFDTTGYILLGISLFLSILIALAIALILGAFAEDVKKVQGLIAPLMILLMVPYFMTMLMDVNSTTPLIKYLVYAIPFSHSFLAAPNLFMHSYSPIIYGIIYQLIVFIIFVVIAARIFSTDRILTMKLNFKKKKSISL